ncbi:MAG TPA: glycosyltransferase family 1 protein [Thermoanaerobaculia bacterium]|nr:glycosyltransferase family 1 protein [Thermoanaerobaculia bacterium]
MRLLIDGRPLVGNRTGIGVHTAEIARRLPFDVTIASHAEIHDRHGLESLQFRVDPSPLGVLWQQTKLSRIDAEVLWGPHGTLPLAWKKRAVVTLHDFTSITMPLRHRLKTILSFNLFIGASLELASRVACVSRVVAEEAMRGFGVPASKIEIVPNGVDEFFTPGDGVEEDFILFAGTLEPRKGIDDLIDVWRALPAPRPRLVLCGGVGWGTRIADEDGIVRTGYVTREKLRELYRSAMAFVYPSRHEGFGIPPLEAMACGAPVIATRTGAIPDYAEGAALLVNPGSRDDLRDALLRVLRDAALRRELRARGPERASEWRWERGAKVMSDLIRDASRRG